MQEHGGAGLTLDTQLQIQGLIIEDALTSLTLLLLGVFPLRTDFWGAERMPFLGSEHQDRGPAMALFCHVSQEMDFPDLDLSFITK